MWWRKLLDDGFSFCQVIIGKFVCFKAVTLQLPSRVEKFPGTTIVVLQGSVASSTYALLAEQIAFAIPFKKFLTFIFSSRV